MSQDLSQAFGRPATSTLRGLLPPRAGARWSGPPEDEGVTTVAARPAESEDELEDDQPQEDDELEDEFDDEFDDEDEFQDDDGLEDDAPDDDAPDDDAPDDDEDELEDAGPDDEADDEVLERPEPEDDRSEDDEPQDDQLQDDQLEDDEPEDAGPPAATAPPAAPRSNRQPPTARRTRTAPSRTTPPGTGTRPGRTRVTSREHVDLVVLLALRRGPADGRGVIAWVREASGGQLEAPEQTVYTTLHRLARNRLLRRVRDTASGRRLYAVTESGERAARARLRAWQALSRGVEAVARADA